LDIAGGAAIGFVAGWLGSWLIRRISDEGLQIMISLALVIGCYRLAILTHLSGPIAVVTAGLCMSSPSPQFGMSSDTRTALIGFWSLLDQLLNIVLFMLMGLQILSLAITPVELVPIVFAIPLAIIARAFSVAVPLVLTRERIRDKARGIAVLTWAGLRGGISIALALTLPASPWRTDLLVVAYAVVVFTIVVQGLTISRFLQFLFGDKQPS
jgi:CPA1 family monovalent cation:H+ antiporter